MKRVNVAIAIVVRQNKLLICRRRDGDRLGGFWEFPGGKVEPDESVEQALSRELREEVDIEIDSPQPLATIEHDYPDIEVRLHPFLCRHKAGEPKPLECAEAIWIEPQQLRDYQFPPANNDLIEQIMYHFSPGKI